MVAHPVPHLKKRVSQMYQKQELKKLTISYAEGYICTSSYVWCEIDLLSENNTASIFMEGTTLLGYAIGTSLFKPEYSYKEKTKVYECAIPKKEIRYFLDKVFCDYDLRLLGQAAFEEHPSSNYDYINDTYSYDEYVDGLTIELETIDGTIDKIEMDKFSIGGRILTSFINQCATLKNTFIIM